MKDYIYFKTDVEGACLSSDYPMDGNCTIVAEFEAERDRSKRVKIAGVWYDMADVEVCRAEHANPCTDVEVGDELKWGCKLVRDENLVGYIYTYWDDPSWANGRRYDIVSMQFNNGAYSHSVSCTAKTVVEFFGKEASND